MRHEKAGSTTRRLESKQIPITVMNTQKIIRAHAIRLAIPPEQLSQLLLSHAAGELRAWTNEREESDPGSVWYAGDVPDWLEPHLLQLRREVF